MNAENENLFESRLKMIDEDSSSKHEELIDKWKDESKLINNETIRLLEQMIYKRYSIDRRIELAENEASSYKSKWWFWGVGIFIGLVLMSIGFFYGIIEFKYI